jgi:hypothetical protein
MRFYSFNDIRAVADCAAFAADVYGVTIRNGRCAAAWRGGDNPEGATIEKSQFYDHVAKRGGGIFELAAWKCGGSYDHVPMQTIQAYLGDYYRLTPKMETGAAPDHECRYTRLIRDGYIERARYEYRDLADAVRHVTVRLQHPERDGKEFVQGHVNGNGGIKWTLKGVDTVLYRLPEIAASEWVLICEGEKSANRLASLGLPATTAPMGAGKWRDSYSDALAGKDVAIAPDNDAPGVEHANSVARALYGKARSIRIIGPLSAREKGGIDDWLDEGQGQSAESVLAVIAAAPEWTPPAAIAELDANTGPSEDELQRAKAANSVPFRNYVPNTVEKQVRGKAVKETIREPRTHAAMLDDLHLRFLGFPRRVGSYTLFDHDRDTGEIIEMDKAHDFRAWIARRSKHNPEFAKGDSLATELDFMATIRAETKSYEAVSLVPDWPRRGEVYYAHDRIPPPSPGHQYLNAFADFFLPAETVDAMLIKSFICAPLWYIPGVPRPAWIIDSRDGQGSGKSLLAFMVAELYGGAPLTVTRHDLDREQKEIRKRCVCAEGRNKRIFLVDNVTGVFKSPELASLITFKYISGLAPYGHGEESRPNNFVYVITSNTATVDSDLADRSLYIYVKKPSIGTRIGWVERVQDFIRHHRMNVMADIIDMLERHTPFDMQTETRFSEFEQSIIQPCAGSPDEMRRLLHHIVETRKDSNIEDEQARSIIETFEYQLRRLGLEDLPVFVHTKVANSWGGQALSDTLHTERSKNSDLPTQIIRQLAAQGKIPQIDPSIKRWPISSNQDRFRGIAWKFSDTTERATMIYMQPDNTTIDTKTI